MDWTKFKVAIRNNEFKIYHNDGKFDLFFTWSTAYPNAVENGLLLKESFSSSKGERI